MSYIGLKDLFERGWCYTPRGIRKLVERDDFPRPIFTINGGMKVWFEPDIKNYEAGTPYLFDNKLKEERVKGYARAILKKQRREG